MCYTIYAQPWKKFPIWVRLASGILPITGYIIGKKWDELGWRENCRFTNRSFLYEPEPGEYTNNPRYLKPDVAWVWKPDQQN